MHHAVLSFGGEPSAHKYTNRGCPAFARFVNTYHTRVVHARADVDMDPECSVGALPSLEYHSCRAVEETFPALPAFPVVYVDSAGRIRSASDSQCARCLAVRSYGSPCDFCATEGYALQPTCRQHLSGLVPCMGGRSSKKRNRFVAVPLDRLDDAPDVRCLK